MKTVTQFVQRAWQSILLSAAAIILLLPLAASAQSASAGVGGRVANPDPTNPRSQSIFIYTLDHKQTKKDQLLVVNQTDQPQTVSLGSVDGVVTNSGDYTCRQASEPVESSGGWVKLSKTKLTIAAKAEQRVDFTVEVPERADVGEHNSCLTVQVDGEESDAVSGVRLHMRQAVRMIVTVPGELKRELSIERFEAAATGTQQRYIFEAANTGNVSADIDMQVRVTSLFGREVAAAGGQYPIVPGNHLTKEFLTEHRPLFGGWYTATPSLRYDVRLGAFGTQNEQAKYETQTGDSITLFFWPTSAGWLIIVGSVAALLLGLWWWRRRRSEFMTVTKSLKPHTVEPGDTLQGLSEKVNADWKMVARINKLAAPYTLEPGTTIQLPTLYLSKQPESAEQHTIEE